MKSTDRRQQRNHQNHYFFLLFDWYFVHNFITIAGLLLVPVYISIACIIRIPTKTDSAVVLSTITNKYATHDDKIDEVEAPRYEAEWEAKVENREKDRSRKGDSRSPSNEETERRKERP